MPGCSERNQLGLILIFNKKIWSLKKDLVTLFCEYQSLSDDSLLVTEESGAIIVYHSVSESKYSRLQNYFLVGIPQRVGLPESLAHVRVTPWSHTKACIYFLQSPCDKLHPATVPASVFWLDANWIHYFLTSVPPSVTDNIPLFDVFQTLA